MAACKGCGRSIIWHKNKNGKNEPFDAKPTRVIVDLDGPPTLSYMEDQRTAGLVEYNPEVPGVVVMGHLPHFVTCPNADRFRKGGKKP